VKIQLHHYEKAYRLGRLLHEEKVELSAARKELALSGLNPSSGSNLLRNVRHMLRGENYRRKMSVPATEFYLSSIRKDDGEPGLARALDSLRQHIAYYSSLYGDPMQSHQAVLDSFGAPANFDSPEELSTGAAYPEGSTRQVLVNTYERNSAARAACLAHYGHRCTVCDFDFGMTYGPIGKDFIHVHHLKEIASIAKEYQVDPIQDLRPVCPNCHAMLHRRKPAFSIGDLKQVLCAQPHAAKATPAAPASFPPE
jgi:5-methylcytosine-specific restriction protein A